MPKVQIGFSLGSVDVDIVVGPGHGRHISRGSLDASPIAWKIGQVNSWANLLWLNLFEEGLRETTFMTEFGPRMSGS